MDWIANMRGPDFLLFYVALITCVLLSCRYAVFSSSPGPGEQAPQIPARPDPYEIAYLRGGDQEVARVGTVSLVQRGFLEVRDNGEVSAARQTVPARDLLPVERALWDAFNERPERSKHIALERVVAPHVNQYRDKLRSQGFLRDEESEGYARRAALIGCAIVLAVGLFKLTVALERGRSNIGFLIALGIVGCVAIGFASVPPRVTRRGRAWLDAMRTTFAGLQAEPGAATAGMSHLPLLVSVFGMSALAATAYAPLARERYSGEGSSAYSCGGSDSSVGGGSGGGGGDAGGDGGSSGCGGCGGGGE